MDHAKRATLIGAAATAASLAAPAIGRAQSPPSFIFIAIDDLNDFPSPFGGYPGIVTPNFARLARMGTVFRSAYAQVPACSPSRTAVLLGVSAVKSGVYFNAQKWDEARGGPYPTLPGHLRANGYRTFGAGKVFHAADRNLRASDWDGYFMPVNANHLYPDANNIISETAKAEYASTGNEGDLDFGPSENGGRGDLEIADWAISQPLVDPFFLAVGFKRPHLPFVVPKHFFDLYPERPQLPLGFYPGATQFSENSADRADLGRVANNLVQASTGWRVSRYDEYHAFLRGYLASTSFVDYALGQLLDAYEAGLFGRNAYVVLWSDHGWQLGEKMSFRKFTLWERALRVPFIIAGPRVLPQSVEEPVGLIDIYPTISELAGLAPPPHCDGRSLMPTLLGGESQDDRHVLSFWGNLREDPAEFRLYQTVRTRGWRLIDYGNDELELYDHDADPHEWHNVASTAPSSTVSQLRSYLAVDVAPPV